MSALKRKVKQLQNKCIAQEEALIDAVQKIDDTMREKLIADTVLSQVRRLLNDAEKERGRPFLDSNPASEQAPNLLGRTLKKYLRELQSVIKQKTQKIKKNCAKSVPLLCYQQQSGHVLRELKLEMEILDLKHIISQDIKPLQDKEPHQDIEPLEDMEPHQDIEPLKDIKPHQDIEPHQDLELLQDMKPHKDIEPLQDMEPCRDLAMAPLQDMEPHHDMESLLQEQEDKADLENHTEPEMDEKVTRPESPHDIVVKIEYVEVDLEAQGYPYKFVEKTEDWSPQITSEVDNKRKPFKCVICKKAFRQKGNLQVHERTHTGVKPYKCDFCGKTFTQSGNLDAHRKTHTGAKPYKCDFCGKTFTQSGNLDAHRKTHTGVKPYKCDFCGKTFTQSGNLDAHRKTHTGEQPYKCGICKKRFIQKGNLQTHLRTHTQKYHYLCQICGKKFLRENNLQTHLQIHIGKKR